MVELTFNYQNESPNYWVYSPNKSDEAVVLGKLYLAKELLGDEAPTTVTVAVAW